MSKKEKLLERARNNPDGLKFSDFETLLKYLGWVFKRQKGSHRMWVSTKNSVLAIQDRAGKSKGYQVVQALKTTEKETGEKLL